jgi:hypothetical protein
LNNTDAVPPYETSEIGTPLDYSNDVYRVYFEVRDHGLVAKKIISDYVGEERASKIVTLTHGYETELPIQAVPDIVRLLAAEDIAVYQAVRYAKTHGVWAG